jgi:hypothetical protein
VFGEVFAWTLIIDFTVGDMSGGRWFELVTFYHGDVKWGGVTFCGRDFCHDDVL